MTISAFFGLFLTAYPAAMKGAFHLFLLFPVFIICFKTGLVAALAVIKTKRPSFSRYHPEKHGET